MAGLLARFVLAPLKGLLRLIADHPWQVALLIAVATAWWAWRGWNGAIGDIEMEQTAHRQTEARYAAAQVEAARIAREEREKVERQYKDIAHEADLRAAQAEGDYMRLAGDYARRMRAETACRPTGPARAAAEDSTAGDRDGPGSDAVVVSRTDFDLLNRNTVRLEQVRQWGEDLAAAGLAD